MPGFYIRNNVVIVNHRKQADYMDTEKVWGIDLTGRKMWYEPWPVDENGVYHAPSEEEITETYGISGEAVRETLLYFEECGGETVKLVEMLNNHVVDERYNISRRQLLDPARWYNNEYYFYFIMFTKKIIGRYNFHFGENSNEQLSVYHKIYEKGLMNYIPYGKDEDGIDIHDYAMTNILGPLLYLEDIAKIDSGDFIKFLNTSFKDNFTIGRDFFKNESYWLNAEFIQYGYSFILIISNDNFTLQKAADYTVAKRLRTARLIINVSRKAAHYSLMRVTSKANSVFDYIFKISGETFHLSATFKSTFNLHKYSKYYYSCIIHSQKINIGAFTAVIKILYRINDVKFDQSSLYPYNNGFTIIYKLNLFYRKRIIKALVALVIAYALFIPFIYLHNFNLYLYSIISTVTASILFWNLLLRLENNELQLKLDDNSKVAIDQLEVLEKTSAELLEERNMLEQKVTERTSELAAANEKLLELDRMKTNFFANISHELRTPLTLMLTPVKGALKGTALGSNDLEMIERNGSNLLSLINDLLDVSRITAGRMELKAAKTDSGRMLKSCCAEMESAAKLKGLVLNCEVPLTPVELYVDEKIIQVISNLFSNSFKFTEPGGRIDVKLTGNDSEAILTFSDTGSGIPADKIGMIFERFTQADTTSTRRYEGTGIGLSIVKDIVELHGGKISVTSRHVKDFPQDHGTLFTITIPVGMDHFKDRTDVEILEDPDSPYESDMPHGAVITGTFSNISLPHIRGIGKPSDKTDFPANSENFNEEIPTILVVEDNTDMRGLLERMLTGMYNVFSAADGFKALEVLDSNSSIDLVLSDIMMPGMDGHELLEHIRSDERYEGLPVIFLTARADQFMKLEGLDLGAIDYVTKPFSSDELMLRIRNQMAMKIMRNRLVEANNRLYAQLKNRSDSDNTSVSSSTEKKLERVIEFIKENYTSSISREGIASAVDMSPDHLSRSFKRHTGKRIDSYINELRIMEAKRQLLETDKTVIRIAFDTGFESISPFNRVFLDIEGMSPTKYRKIIRNGSSLTPVSNIGCS